MGDVFDRWRLNCGWNPWDDTTQDAAITSFVHSLDREGIPSSAYAELYERVLSVRARAIQDGRQIPQFGVELLISQWTGEYGLRAELRQREIDRGRTLMPNAETVCRHCLGSGWRKMGDDRTAPVTRCDHTD